jgi:hypothetical protein
MFENVLSWFILCVILVRVLTFICLVFFPSTVLLSVQLTIQQAYLSVYADLSNPLTVALTNNICTAVSSRPSLFHYNVYFTESDASSGEKKQTCVSLVRALKLICSVFFPSTVIFSVQLIIQQAYLSKLSERIYMTDYVVLI